MSIRKAPARVEIRTLAENEISILDQHLHSGPANRHRQRYLFQKGGEGECLVAWYRGVPVGHGVISWFGAPDEPMASRSKDCPDIEDLFVMPRFRSQGVGAQLLAALEELARRRGHSRVGLGVALDNPRARALYERSGYRETDFGEYTHYVYRIDDLGTARPTTETCIYMIKELV